MKKILRWFVILLLLIGIGLGAAYLWLRGSGQPVRSGEQSLSGLTAPVTVRFDDWAVPHIEAQQERDLAAAVGWLHANDRMTQMEMGRRLAFGRLSELLGNAGFGADIYYRNFDFAAVADGIESQLDERSRAWLEGYADGVNAWLGRGERPPGLVILRADPQPWTVRDSIGFYLLMAHNLSFFQGRPEEARFRVLSILGPEPTADVLGPTAILDEAILEAARRWAPPANADGQETQAAIANPRNGHLAQLARSLGAVIPDLSDDPGAAWGSNAWAVGSEASATGAPLLANDPHLPLNLPPTWFQVHLATGDLRLGGFTLPGLPFIIVGRSDHLAWGVTANMLDDHDLFIEEFSDAGTEVRRGDGWQPVDKRVETFLVGGETRTVDYRRTDIGPLLAADERAKVPARSLAWTVLRETTDPFVDFLNLTRATTVDEAYAGLGGYVGAAQNLLVADRDGGLLQTVLGRVPQRRAGDGTMLLPAWDPAYGWEALAPQSTNPTVIAAGTGGTTAGTDTLEGDVASTTAAATAPTNGEVGDAIAAQETANGEADGAGAPAWPAPEGGLLASANDPPPQTLEPAAGAYDLPFRAQRIRQLVASRTDWDAEATAQAQSDVLCLFSRDLIPRLQARTPFGGENGDDAGRALEALAAWDGRMEATGPSALFSLVENRLIDAIFLDESTATRAYIGSRELLLGILQGEIDESWADDRTTDAVETLDATLAAALGGAWRDGVAAWGDDVAAWPYAQGHTLRINHILGAVPVLGPSLGRGPFPLPGSYTTVLAFDGPPQDAGETTPVNTGPTSRWIADLGADDNRAALPGGQSGHPYDEHYDDQLEDFLAGRTHPAPWSAAAVEEATASVLTLTP